MGILIEHKNQVNLCIISHILWSTEERGKEKGGCVWGGEEDPGGKGYK